MQTYEPTPRAPQTASYACLALLPPGQVCPSGWLQRWAQINAEGWLLHYARNQDPDVYGKFWHRNQTSRIVFSENNETLILCDYTAYLSDGMLHYAALCPDSQLAREADLWLDRLLASQDTDGYIGAFVPQARWQHWLEIFSQTLTFEALLFRYEHTGDLTYLTACQRAAEPLMRAWYEPDPQATPGIFSGHGTISVRFLGKLYRLTGDSRYRDCARAILERYGWMERFLQPGDALHDQHNVIGSEHVGLPAMLYEYVGEQRWLEASQAAWEMMAREHLSIDGTPHGNEGMRQKGPRQNCEHCSAVEWFVTSNALFRMTADVQYADAAEHAILNGYPAAKSPDGMLVGYMHAPNELVASEWSSPSFDSLDWWASRQHYHLAHEPLCCNSNGPRGIPYYVESMVMLAKDAPTIVYYGPCAVEMMVPGAGHLTLRMDTRYPFEDQVRVTVSLERPATFPLQFRIPGWCSGAKLMVNGEPVLQGTPGTLALVQREWRPGDQVVLHLDVPIRVALWPKSEFGVRVPGIAIQRGPLVFALPVPENWQQFEAVAHGPGQQLVSYRLFPADGAVWNYALIIDPEHPEKYITPVQLPVSPDARPWEEAPLGLQVRAHRVLNWRMDGEPDHPMTPGLPYDPMQLSPAEETITLVPFGFTHLRLAYLPYVTA